MGSLRVGHDWATSLSLFNFLHWRRKWQPTPVFLLGESQGRGSLVAAVYGVTQSQTRLKWLSSSSSSIPLVKCIPQPFNHTYQASYCTSLQRSKLSSGPYFWGNYCLVWWDILSSWGLTYVKIEGCTALLTVLANLLKSPHPPVKHWNLSLSLSFKKTIYWFIWLHQALVATQHSLWDLSSPTRDWTHIPCAARQILHRWTTRRSLRSQSLLIDI